MAYLPLFVPVLFLALFVHTGEAVRCWTCSSDLNPICNDPFLIGQRSDGADYYNNYNNYNNYNSYRDNSYAFKLENCDANSGASYPYLTSSKSACKKQKKYINGQLVISRGCTWKRADDYSSSCPASSNGPNEVTSYCETCEYDGCNGASTISKTLALALAPLAILLFK